MKKIVLLIAVSIACGGWLRHAKAPAVSGPGICQTTNVGADPGFPISGSSFFGPTGDPNVDQALWQGARWAQNIPIWTFSFPTSASFYGGSGYGGGGSAYTAGFSAFDADHQAAVRVVLAQYAAILNVVFTEIVEDSTHHAQFRYAYTNAGALSGRTADTFSPGTKSVNTSQFGDTWFNSDVAIVVISPVPGNFSWGLTMHEIGHAFGLKHPFTVINGFPLLNAPYNATIYTDMAYDAYYISQTSSGGFTAETWGYPQLISYFDIRSLRVLYSHTSGPSAGAATYTWDNTTGQMKVNGVAPNFLTNGTSGVQPAPGAYRIYDTIWNPCATSITFDTSNFTTAQTVDLRQADDTGSVGWSTFDSSALAQLGSGNLPPGNVVIALETVVNNATTGSGNDSLTGNSGNNVLDGGAGTDTVHALDTFGNSTVTMLSANHCQLVSPLDGTDTLVNIEVIVYSGGTTKNLSSTCVQT